MPHPRPCAVRCVCRAGPLPRGASACLVRAARCWSGRSAGGGCRAAGRGGLLRLAVLLHGWQAHRPAPHCAVRTERPTARDRRAVGCGARAAPRRSRLRHGRAIGDADGGADGAAERGLSCGSGARPLRTRANARSLRAHPPSRLQTPNARCASARAKPHTRIDRSATSVRPTPAARSCEARTNAAQPAAERTVGPSASALTSIASHRRR